ncbi:MAG: 5-bromo-4-chloroindolyl phosphate hydrolysis family protein [Oscillospiraceae bacterium]|nr:5-bromo-4-chloroindolyl phosphate hydrolysis family protein [Oscillospiraceae bacterium]
MANNSDFNSEEFERQLTELGKTIGKTIQTGLGSVGRDLGQSFGTVGRDIGKSLENAAKSIENASQEYRKNVEQKSAAGYYKPLGNKPVYAQSRTAPKPQKRSTTRWMAKLRSSLGLAQGMFFSFLTTIFGGVAAILVAVSSSNATTDVVAMLAVAAVLAVFSLASLIGAIKGFGTSKLNRRFCTYQNILEGRSSCTIEELAASSAFTEPQVLKDLQKMLDNNYFEEGMITPDKKMFFTNREAYQKYIQFTTAPQQQITTPQQSAERVILAEGANFLAKLRSAQNMISDPEVKEKVEHIYKVSEQIFTHVTNYPEKAEQIRKFSKYYLPTTVKLLDTYTKMDVQEVEGTNVDSIRKDINGILYTMGKAYDNLLDSLYEDVALDVSTDIAVLKGLLEQEGLTEENTLQLD